MDRHGSQNRNFLTGFRWDRRQGRSNQGKIDLDRKLILELLCLSSRFEPRFLTSVTTGQDSKSALTLLGSLETEVLASLASDFSALAASVPAPAKTPAPTAATRPPVPGPRPTSRNQEYRPALEDQNLVEALMAFHRQNRLNPKHPQPASFRAGANNAMKAAAQTSPPKPEEFRNAQSPAVSANPKRPPLYTQKASSRILCQTDPPHPQNDDE